MKIPLAFPEPTFGYDRFEADMAAAEGRGERVIRLRVRRPLEHKAVDLLLNNEELGRLYAGELSGGTVHLVVDLRDCPFLDPYGSTVIQSLVAKVCSQGTRVWVCLPAVAHVRAYCGVSGLTEALREQVTLVGESYRYKPSDSSAVLVPVRVFSAAADVPGIVEASVQTLESLLARLEWPKGIVSAAVAAIKEVTMNVVEHAGASGSFNLQAYKLDSDDPYIVVALSDSGVGIRATLERKYSDLPPTDGAMLERLFARNLTSREDHQQGHGMRTLRDAVRSVRGTLHMRSGAGLYYASGKATWQATRAPIPGTHLRLALNGPRD